MCENTDKRIRFIDSQYRNLFSVPDGGNVVLTYADGEKRVKPCKYIDEYHFYLGDNVLHICQFAEIMERNGTAYAPEIPPELPERCFTITPSSGELILIEKYKKGYGQCGFSTLNPERNRKEADRLNEGIGVTPQQEAAMLGGSLFGWSTPAAKIASYDVRGNPIAHAKTKAKPPKSKGLER